MKGLSTDGAHGPRRPSTLARESWVWIQRLCTRPPWVIAVQRYLAGAGGARVS